MNKHINKASQKCATPLSAPTYVMGAPEGKQGKKGEKIMAEGFPNSLQNINLHIQEG